MEIWPRVNCFDLCKNSYFTCIKKKKKTKNDVIRLFEVRIVIIALLF